MNILLKKSRNKKKSGNNQSIQFFLSQKMMLMLVMLQAANLLTLSMQLSLWFLAISALCLLWQLAIHQKVILTPSKTMLIFIAITGCFLLAVSAKGMGILLAMVHLLSLSYLLKPFEIKQRKDFYQLFILGILILATAFIFHQSIYFTVVILILLIVNISWLFSYFSMKKIKYSSQNIAIKMVLLSLPLAIALFIFFPKISPFWHVPLANAAKTGLSDKVSIGDISSLALSNELAFRVEFEGNAPSYSQLYWRTLVLENFDGKQWNRKRVSRENIVKPDSSVQTLQANSNNVRYQVIAQPSYQHWLFVLDVANLDEVKQNKIVYQLNDFTFYSRDKVAQPLLYNVTSTLGTPLDIELNPQAKALNLLFEPQSNPRLVVFAKELNRRNLSSRALVQVVLDRFREKDYRYTLNPPLLTNNSLDEFFFDTQAGFCEHYASSFTYLMRAAGIPARIVLGYLGGEYNAQGQYYSIYQRDAHAWSEVWLEDIGWIRVDPTASVDPSRVEQGFSEQLMSEQLSLSPTSSLDAIFSGALLNQLRLHFDAIDFQWTKFVINFSQDKQKKLLDGWFGEHIPLKSGLIVAMAVFLTGLVTFLLNKFYIARQSTSLWYQYFANTHKNLAKLSLVKSNEQLQSDFTNKVLYFDAKLGKSYQLLIKYYEQCRYQKISEIEKKHMIDKMKQQSKACNKRINNLAKKHRK